MRDLIFIAVAIAVSTTIYVVTYWLVLDFPLRFAFQGTVLDAKSEHARRNAATQKIVVISGSNSLYGISCAQIHRATGRQCVNAGTAATFDLFFTVDLMKPYLRKGDVVYLPLEYNLYLEHTSPVFVGHEALLIVMRDRQHLSKMTPMRALHTLFYLDLAMALRAVGEMTRRPEVAERIKSRARVNRYGDFLGNRADAGERYRWRVDNAPSYVPRFNREFRDLDNAFGRRLGAFLDWCRARGIVVVGGLSTAFDDTALSEKAIGRLKKFFNDHGQRFLALTNRGQYPRRMFFDREFHLNDVGRRQHTGRVIDALQEIGLLPARPR